MRDFIDFRHFVQLKWCNSILRFFQYEELEILIKNDEHRQLELKKTTGELKDCMHSACAFLNTEGGWFIFGVTPSSLKILGQEVTDNT